MIGSWRWNLISAGVLGALIFFLAHMSNPLGTSLYRAGISFAIGFAATYAVRFLLGQSMPDGGNRADSETAAVQRNDEEGKGQSVDMVTPEDEPEIDFSPLSPPKLTKVEESLDPEQLAQVVRHISDK